LSTPPEIGPFGLGVGVGDGAGLAALLGMPSAESIAPLTAGGVPLTRIVAVRDGVRRACRFLRLLVVSLRPLLFCDLAVGGLIVGGLMRLPESLGASCAPAFATNAMTHSASVAKATTADLCVVRRDS